MGSKDDITPNFIGENDEIMLDGDFTQRLQLFF